MTTRRFGGEIVDVRAARRFVRSIVDVAGGDGELAELLTSELVSNVITHAPSHFDVVVVASNDRTRVEIHDGAAVTAAFRELVHNLPPKVEPSAVTGRGIVLVRSSATDFGLIDKGDSGKAVWFELHDHADA